MQGALDSKKVVVKIWRSVKRFCNTENTDKETRGKLKPTTSDSESEWKDRFS